MGEQMDIESSKGDFGGWRKNTTPLINKIRDFLLEIFIIVFSISLSIWLNNVWQHRQEQARVKTFLLGLKQDLSEDIDEIESILKYKKEGYDVAYQYLSNLQPHTLVNQDTFNFRYENIWSNAYLRPNTSRYDGFKSNGELTNIENDSLTYKILYFYQEAIPQLKSSENGWLNSQAKLIDYLVDNLQEPDNRIALITSPKGKFLCKKLIGHDQLYKRYNQIIDRGKSIIADIDKIYGIEKMAKP